MPSISACEQSADLPRALQSFGAMQQKGTKPDAITYTASISACEESAKPEKVLQIFDEMRQEGTERDASTYSAAISFSIMAEWINELLALCDGAAGAPHSAGVG